MVGMWGDNVSSKNERHLVGQSVFSKLKFKYYQWLLTSWKTEQVAACKLLKIPGVVLCERERCMKLEDIR